MIRPYVLAQESLRKFLRTGVAIDTEILLVLAVGRYQKRFIREFKKTRQFTEEDYDLLVGFLTKFKNLIVSPHVLAEVSNHSFQMALPRLGSYLDKLIEFLQPFVEEYVTKGAILTHQRFKTLGVTDTGLLICCRTSEYLLLTKDRQLCGIAQQSAVEALHFDDLRVYWLNAQLNL